MVDPLFLAVIVLSKKMSVKINKKVVCPNNKSEINKKNMIEILLVSAHALLKLLGP